MEPPGRDASRRGSRRRHATTAPSAALRTREPAWHHAARSVAFAVRLPPGTRPRTTCRGEAMPDAPELPPRPLPPRGAVTLVGEWLRWIGTARLVASAVSVVIVVGGAVWLLRAPAPPTEASIPVAQGSAPTVTLPAPATAPRQTTAT